MDGAVRGVAITVVEGVGGVGDGGKSADIVKGPDGGAIGEGITVGATREGAIGPIFVSVADGLVEGIELLHVQMPLEVARAVGDFGMKHAASGDGSQATESVVGIHEVGRGVAVGFVGVVHGFEASAVVVAVGGDDAALPGAGFKTAGIGVGVVGAVTVRIGFPGKVTACWGVGPSGGGGCGAVGGECFLPIGVVVGVGGAVGLIAGGFVDVSVREVVGGGDVGEGVVIGIDGVWGINVGAASANVVKFRETQIFKILPPPAATHTAHSDSTAT